LIERILLSGEGYEPYTLAFLKENLGPGDCAVLAGVNFGAHIAVAAVAVGPTGRVIGIEPQPAALLRAHDNLVLNGLADRVRLVAAALGADEAFVHMPWSSSENPGAVSIFDEGQGLFVPVVPMSRLLIAASETSPKLLLLDVQGYEKFVLQGISASSVPPIAVVEFDPEFLEKAAVTADNLCDTMKELGYELSDVFGQPLPDRVTDFPERNVIGVKVGVPVRWASRNGRTVQ